MIFCFLAFSPPPAGLLLPLMPLAEQRAEDTGQDGLLDGTVAVGCVETCASRMLPIREDGDHHTGDRQALSGLRGWAWKSIMPPLASMLNFAIGVWS